MMRPTGIAMTKPPIGPTHPYSKAVLAHVGSAAHKRWAARVQELLDARVTRLEAEVRAARELLGLEEGPVAPGSGEMGDPDQE
jgi:hypothetical protein